MKKFDKYFIWNYINVHDLPVEVKLLARKIARGTYELEDGSRVKIWKGMFRVLEWGPALLNDVKFLLQTDGWSEEDVEQLLKLRIWWSNVKIED